MGAEAETPKKTPEVIPTHLYEECGAWGGKKKRRKTCLQGGDRIAIQKTETAWTISFTRDLQSLMVDDSPHPDDKLLVPNGMDPRHLVAIISAVTGLTATPIGRSTTFMIWQL